VTTQQLDKIKGVFYGQAIGDALGLGTEFMNKAEVAKNYPNGLTEYSQITQDKHRSRWEIGDWTDDTDQFLCICDSIIKTNKVDELAFAQELYAWFNNSPMGIGTTVYRVVSTPQFTLYPNRAAELIWKMRRKQIASNGAIMRTSVLGCYEFHDYKKVVANTEKIAKVTHWDSRCVGSCVIITLIISHILSASKYLTAEQIYQIADSYDSRIKEFIELSQSASIEQLHLDEPDSLGYTLKAMSAGLWVYFHATDFETGLLKVINEGGDADTNASVAGSLLGAKFGFNSIPRKYIEGLKYREVLDEKFEKIVALI
jgi:ADP-ribosylglycohydrolase